MSVEGAFCQDCKHPHAACRCGEAMAAVSKQLRPSLTDLANKYQSDKGTKWSRGTFKPHGYTPAYDALLAPRRDEPLRVLEIGVAEGCSLQMWREYFPNAEIFGLDIKDPIAVPGCTVLQGDQGNVFDLHSIPGSFDLIVDDGSHKMQHQLTSFYTLMPYKVNPGGIYIIEDLHLLTDNGRALVYFMMQFNKEQHRGVKEIMMEAQGRFLVFTREGYDGFEPGNAIKLAPDA